MIDVRSETGMGVETTALDLEQLPDADLLARFVARRDPAAFAALVSRHGPLVLGLCRRLIRHEQDAEDAFQATFLVFLRKAGSIGKYESVGSWLYGVAYRVSLKANIAAARRRSRETSLPEAAAFEVARDATGIDLGAALDAEVNRLPPRFRRAVVLCYLQGWSAQQAARALGCPRGTILSRLARARARLRDRLTRRGFVLTATAVAVALTRNRVEAAVPGRLGDSTIQAATGSAAAGAVSANAGALAHGVLQAMRIAKLKVLAVVLGILALGAAGVLVPRALADKDAKPADGKASLDGTWVAVTTIKDGAELAKENNKVTSKDSTFTMIKGDKELKGKVQIDATKKPATIDIEVTEGDEKGKSSSGIYELAGDDLKICLGLQGTPRPTEFDGKAGSGCILVTLKREKK